MMNAIDDSIPNIGYLYHYPKMEQPGENFCLEIYMLSAQTEQHFDVRHARFFVTTKQNTVETLTIMHPWDFDETFQVCAGLIEMEDWKGKKEEAFTFGGRLRVVSDEIMTNCNLTSSAPILEISGATPLHSIFIEEIEILFAKRKAAYESLHEYEARLIKVNPLLLYRACLEAIIDKYKNIRQKDEKYAQFLLDLWRQKHRIEATPLAKGPVPSLNEIL